MAENNFNYGKGFTFSKHIKKDVSDFDRVFGVFKELLTHTSGDIEEAFEWLNTLDAEYNIFNDNYNLEDFEEDLNKRGYIKKDTSTDKLKSGNGKGNGKNILTAKLESALRDYALNQVFGKLKKSGLGNHSTSKVGIGDERDGENRSFQFGDDLTTVNMTESLKNAQINNGISDL
jgi:Ca-activated chloride channel family protein